VADDLLILLLLLRLLPLPLPLPAYDHVRHVCLPR